MNPLTGTKGVQSTSQTAGAYGYDDAHGGTVHVAESANVIVPVLLKHMTVESVVDYGCGLGDWLAAFRRLGVVDILGLDGPWIPESHLKIPNQSFRSTDLLSGVRLQRRFDLALCLEVLEHLDPSSGDAILDELTNSSDVVCFSAAIPGQGGHEHINEQFQSYWINEFDRRGFTPFDLVRPEIWWNRQVCFWYRQNMIVFANRAGARKMDVRPTPFIADCVHPELFDRTRDPRNYSPRMMLKQLPFSLMRSLRSRMTKIVSG